MNKAMSAGMSRVDDSRKVVHYEDICQNSDAIFEELTGKGRDERLPLQWPKSFQANSIHRNWQSTFYRASSSGFRG